MEKKKIILLYYDLLDSYNYKNKKKLTILFDFWLDLFILGVKKNLEMPKNCLDIYYGLSKNFFNIPNEEAKRSKRFYFFKRVFKSILRFIPLPYGVVIGGVRKKIDIIISIITYIKLEHLNSAINSEMKAQFFQLSEIYFEEQEFFKLKDTISDSFFLQKHKTKLLPASFYGSPNVFYFQEMYINLLFTNQRIRFTGYQHGAQYGEFIKDRFYDFEVKFCNEFYFWGLGEKNITQNRFKVKNKVFKNINQIFRVENIATNVVLNRMFGGYNEIYNNLDNKRFNKEYEQLISGLIAHPRSNVKHSGKYGKIIKFNNMGESEIYSTLFILDFPSSTFLYKAIYENLPFILFINKDWRKWFTSNYNTFLDHLRLKKVLFYWHEELLLIENLKNMKEAKTLARNNNEDLRLFLEKGLISDLKYK